MKFFNDFSQNLFMDYVKYSSSRNSSDIFFNFKNTFFQGYLLEFFEDFSESSYKKSSKNVFMNFSKDSLSNSPKKYS